MRSFPEEKSLLFDWQFLLGRYLIVIFKTKLVEKRFVRLCQQRPITFLFISFQFFAGEKKNIFCGIKKPYKSDCRHWNCL
jgi:hypothetical protein